MFAALNRLLTNSDEVGPPDTADGNSSGLRVEIPSGAAGASSVQIDILEAARDISSEEAQYFQNRLRTWYDHTDEVAGAAARRKSVTSPPGSPFSPGRKRNFAEASTSFSPRVLSIERKTQAGPAPKLRRVSKVDPSQGLGGSVLTAETIRHRLGTIGKAELTGLVIEYHRALVDLGHVSESNLLLEAAFKLLPTEAVAGEPELTGVDKLLKDGLLAFLLKLQKHMPSLPSQVIFFKDLAYTSQVLVEDQQFPTVGSALLGCLLPCFRRRGQFETFDVLKECSGYLMPGTLTLVCGPPGCGKTSLHKALAGRLLVEKSCSYTGTVTYNGRKVEDVNVRRVAAYIGQTDRHYPTLTVRETCEFASECTSSPFEEKAIAGVSGDHGQTKLKMELLLHLLGLRGPADTIVGNQFVRGVSGGERHRVTTAEMVAGTYLAFFLDEISTGLDSSATYDIVSAVRMLTRIQQMTCLLSLLQPSPEVFGLIDRLIVLAEGRIIYQGPCEDVLPYFSALGYVKPQHVDVADFLQEITTPEGRQFLQPGFHHLDAESFMKAYKSSDLHREVLRIINAPKVMHEIWVQADKPLGLKLRDGEGIAGEKNVIEVCEVDPNGNIATANIKQTARVKEGDCVTGVLGANGRLEYIAGAESAFFAADVVKKVVDAPDPVRMQLQREREEVDTSFKKAFEKEFVQDWFDSTRTVLGRQGKLLIRNRSFVVARFSQVLILGIFTGTLFYQVPPGPERSEMDLRKSLSFTACMAMALATMSQIPVIIEERKVFEKQYAARFYRANSYVIAITLAQIPYTVVEMIVYCPLIYWLTGLSSAQHGVHFLMYIAIVFAAALMGAALTRFLASVARTRESAMSSAGLCIIIYLLFSGFMITKNKVPYWWIWAYYLSPLQYGVTGLICNEFLSGKYDQPCSAAVSYCGGRMHMTIGRAYLDLYELPTTYFRGVWLSLIILFGYYTFFTCITFWTMGNLRFDDVKLPSAARVLQNKQASTTASYRGRPSQLENRLSGRNPGGSMLKFEPMVFSFHQVSYEVYIPGIKDPRVLISGVSGYVKPGSMMALMGSSGAGKTTLLDVLAGRKTTGRIKGDILLNGYPKVRGTFARVAGYVEQNDIHMKFITVKEALEFSSALRLPRGTSAAQRRAFVNEVLELLELQDVGNKLVGAIGDTGLSVEEAKRLTIGVELAANPSIIFFDEPTSGLDSRAAQVVMRGVNKIVRTGRSVICTIHQPSRRLFLAFDQLLLLKRGGEVAYFGPIGEDAKDLLEYFHSLPGTRRCGEDQNPATYMLEVIGAGIGHAADRDFGVDYRESSLAATNWEELEILRFGKGTLGAEPVVSGYAASFPAMIACVLRRQYRSYWRNVAYSFGRITFAAILAVLLGSAFWQIKYDHTPGMISRGGLVYISVIFMSMLNANNVIPQVNQERPVYYREQASNMYASFIYSISWVMAEIPYLCISTLVFCSICFSMAAVSTDSTSKFFEFWFLFFEYSACITFFGIFMAAMTPNAETATVVIPIVINLWNMTSGFMIAKKDIPSFWIWLYWLNPAQYALNGLTTLAFYCDTSSPHCQSCSLNPTTGTCPSCDCVHVQDQGNLLAWLLMSTARTLDHSKIGFDMGLLAVFTILFMVASMVALRFMKYNRR